jgi:hypothetical protein
MAYEPDMTVIFDPVSKAIAISFRGKLIYLPGPYPSRKTVLRLANSIVVSLVDWTSSQSS